MIEDFSDSYRILDLPPDATLEEVKRSYRELVRVWHPDRFASDPKLQNKAQEKLKLINLAYERICKGGDGDSRRRSTPSGTSTSQAGEQSRPTGSSGSVNNRGEPKTEEPRQPPPPQPQAPPELETNWGYRIVQFGAAVVIMAVIKTGFSTGDRSRGQTTDYSPHYTQPSQTYAPQPEPVPPQVASTPVLEQPAALDKPTSLTGEAVAPVKLPMERTKKVEVALVKARDSVSPAPSIPTQDFFTIGSTKDEVRTIQGAPDRFSDLTFGYGLSEVFFRDGRVASWKQYSSSRLKVRWLPASPVADRSYFTVGSSKDEVLAVQGTPDNFSDTIFGYGMSEVFFRDGRVASWKQYSLSPLKVR